MAIIRKGKQGVQHSGLMKPFAVSPQLKAIIGVPRANRAEVMKFIWRYVKAQKLQDPKDGRFCFPDEKMTAVFGPHRMSLYSTMKYLSPHLLPDQVNNPMLPMEEGVGLPVQAARLQDNPATGAPEVPPEQAPAVEMPALIDGNGAQDAQPAEHPDQAPAAEQPDAEEAHPAEHGNEPDE